MFPLRIGLGANNVSPQAYAWLSHQLLTTVHSIFTLVGLACTWPDAVNLVFIVLLPIAVGGRRPVRLFCSFIRLWFCARAAVASKCVAYHGRRSFYGAADKRRAELRVSLPSKPMQQLPRASRLLRPLFDYKGL